MNNAHVFNLIVEVLRHVKEVEVDVKERSLKAATAFSDALKTGEITPNNDLLCALQYQDIMSQQLSATIEAIEAIDNSISMWIHAFQSDSSMLEDGIVRLDEKLKLSLDEARQKKAAFTGRSGNLQDEIEFF